MKANRSQKPEEDSPSDHLTVTQCQRELKTLQTGSLAGWARKDFCCEISGGAAAVQGYLSGRAREKATAVMPRAQQRETEPTG